MTKALFAILKNREKCGKIRVYHSERTNQMKKIISTLLTLTLAAAPTAALAGGLEEEIDAYPWSETAARYCFDNGILSGDEYGDFDLGGNITRAQMARIFTDAFGLEEADETAFADSKVTDWYYPYSLAIQDYMPVRGENFNGGEYVTREEFAATLVKATARTLTTRIKTSWKRQLKACLCAATRTHCCTRRIC